MWCIYVLLLLIFMVWLVSVIDLNEFVLFSVLRKVVWFFSLFDEWL